MGRRLALRLQALGLQRDIWVRTMALLFDDAPQDFKLAQASLPEQFPPAPAGWSVASVLDRIPAAQRARIALDQSLTKLKIAQSNRSPTQFVGQLERQRQPTAPAFEQHPLPAWAWAWPCPCSAGSAWA